MAFRGEQVSSQLLLLPDELLLAVLGCLSSHHHLGRCCCASKRLNRLASTDNIWKPLLDSAQKRGQKASTFTERRLVAPVSVRGRVRCKKALREHMLLQARNRRWELRRALDKAEELQERARTDLHECHSRVGRLEATARKRAGSMAFWQAPSGLIPRESDASERGGLIAAQRAAQSEASIAQRAVAKHTAAVVKLTRKYEEKDAAMRRLMLACGPRAAQHSLAN